MLNDLNGHRCPDTDSLQSRWATGREERDQEDQVKGSSPVTGGSKEKPSRWGWIDGERLLCTSLGCVSPMCRNLLSCWLLCFYGPGGREGRNRVS